MRVNLGRQWVWVIKQGQQRQEWGLSHQIRLSNFSCTVPTSTWVISVFFLVAIDNLKIQSLKELKKKHINKEAMAKSRRHAWPTLRARCCTLLIIQQSQAFHLALQKVQNEMREGACSLCMGACSSWFVA